MINNIALYLVPENIYLIANWGVVPLWLMVLLMPNHGLTKFFVNSVVVPILLGVAYIFLSYEIFLNENILDVFNLYFGLDNLYAIFSNESFLLIFWLHFLSISLFVGSWISSDSQKYMVPRLLTSISLILTYFTGPIGLLFYWFVRIFFSRKISFND